MALLVNGNYIDDAVLAAEAASIRPRMQAAMKGEPARTIEARVLEWARENVIERALLQWAALNDVEPLGSDAVEATITEMKAGRPGCVLPGSEAELRRGIELQLRMQRLIREIVECVPPPAHEAVAAFYRENIELFTLPEAVHAAHIVKNVDEKTSERKAYRQIEEIAEKLHKGARFEELADQFSDCPGRGGDLGFIAPGQMVDTFERVAFALAPGEISRSFRSVFGFHIVKAYEKRASTVRLLGEVQEEIERELLRRGEEHAVGDFVDGLRAKAEVRDVARRAF